MATDKLIGNKIFDWHYPKDIADAKELLEDIKAYTAEPKNAFALPFFHMQIEAFELLLTIPLQ